MNDEFYMQLVLKQAWKYQLLTYPNPAVACLITDRNGKILSLQAHQKAGEAHAELLAVKFALIKLLPELEQTLNSINNANELYNFIIKNHKFALKGACAYVSLEPCSHFGQTPPCALLLKELNFGRVVFGVNDTNKLASGGANLLANSKITTQKSSLENECKILLEPFTSWQNGHFAFFKIALSANGVFSGKISSDLAQIHSHQIRSLIDLLVIGGNTIRIDRPILDSRKSISKKAPNVLIYTHKNDNDFDKNIALFNVKNRIVEISSNLNKLKNAKFAMIEGGENMLNSLKNEISWLLIYQNSSFRKGKFLQNKINFKILHESLLGDDRALWCKIL